MKNAKINAIINAVFVHGFVDDDDQAMGRQPASVVALQTTLSGIEVVHVDPTKSFVVAPYYIAENGDVHLSAMTSGGRFIREAGDSLEEAVAKYNVEYGYDKWPCKFSQLILIRKKDWIERTIRKHGA